MCDFFRGRGHLPATVPLLSPGGAAEPAPCSGASWGLEGVWQPGLEPTVPLSAWPCCCGLPACLLLTLQASWDPHLPALLALRPSSLSG